MVAQAITYLGTLRCQTTHEPSGVSIITDAPKDNAGQGASFSPTDLVITALGTCIITTMGIWAAKAGFALGPVSAHLAKHMTVTPPRTIAKAVVALTFTTPYTPEQQAVLIKAAHGCPVALALGPNLVQDVSFIWA